MGQLAIVFAGRNGLDQYNVRANVVRIPEVSMRLREAQSIIDSMSIPGIDLLSYITSDDATFLRNLKLKSLASAIVQVALFDRLQKSQVKSDLFIGAKGPDSALDVVAGRCSFAEMVSESAAFQTTQVPARDSLASALIAVPLLSGLALAEYEAISNKVSIAAEIDPKKLLISVTHAQNVNQVISVGPIPLLSIEEQENLGLKVEDSIHRDPALAWFWSDVNPKNVAV